MKKTLILGLALALGLSACEPINTPDQMAYVKAFSVDAADPAVKVAMLGDCFLAEPTGMITTDPVVLANIGDVVYVRIETTFPIWTLEDLNHQIQVGTDPAAPANFVHFGLKNGEQKEIDANLEITYLCPFSVIADPNTQWAEGEKPAFEMGFYTYNLKVERLTDTEAEYEIHVVADDNHIFNFGPKYTGFNVSLPAILVP